MGCCSTQQKENIQQDRQSKYVEQPNRGGYSHEVEGNTDNQSNQIAQTEDAILSIANYVQPKKANVQDTYKILDSINEGTFGKVFKVKHKKTGEIRALKTIAKSNLTAKEKKASFFAEVDILKRMDHPHILKLYEFYEEPSSYNLLTELCTGGELFDRIIDSETGFTEKKAAEIMEQVLSAINYMHSIGYMHRDLKPENLLLESKHVDAPIKLIDFGTAIRFEKGKSMKEEMGTPFYIAPEVLNGNYDEKCDVWSCGVLMYITLCGYPPFHGNTDPEIFRRVRAYDYNFNRNEWDGISKQAKDLISKIFKPASQRPTMQDCLNHPWIKDLSTREQIDRPLAIQSLTRLKNFRSSQKLHQATLQFMVSQLTSAKEKEDMKKVFESLDANGDGKLTREELLEGYKKHMSELDAEEEVDRVMKTVDIDGNGTVDFTEFIAATMNQKQLLSENRIKAAFNQFDTDGSGSISIKELKEALGGDAKLDDKIWADLIKEVDEDGNGEIDIDEFKNMFFKQQQQ